MQMYTIAKKNVIFLMYTIHLKIKGTCTYKNTKAQLIIEQKS